jgi:hypothetical protein
LIKKKFNFLSAVIFLTFWSLKPWIQIGSGFVLDPDPYWIRIRIGIKPKMLDPDPDEMNANPQPCCTKKEKNTKPSDPEHCLEETKERLVGMAAEELPEYGTAGGEYEPMRPQFALVGRDQGHIEEFRPGPDTLQGGANRGMVVRPG